MSEALTVWRAVLLVAATMLALGTTSRNRDYRSGLILAQKTVERYPTSVGRHVLAAELITAGRRDEAEAQLRLALPAAPRAYYTLGALFFEEKRWDEAILNLRRFVDELPLAFEARSARVMIGQAWASERRWADAAEQYQIALTMNPSAAEQIDLRLLLGDALRSQQRFGEALEHYRVYLQARPDAVDGLTGAAIALMGGGHPEQAIVLFRRAAAIDPRDGAVQFNLANALYDDGKFAEAVLQAKVAAGLRPGDARAHDLLGRALFMTGQGDRAIAEFQQALRIDPSAAEVRDHLARVLRLRRSPGSSS